MWGQAFYLTTSDLWARVRTIFCRVTFLFFLLNQPFPFHCLLLSVSAFALLYVVIPLLSALNMSCYSYHSSSIILMLQLKLSCFVSQMLVVQERGGIFRGTGLWKMPTGVVNEVCQNYYKPNYCLQNCLFVCFQLWIQFAGWGSLWWCN